MFQNCLNENDAKKLYRKLALKLHPDCGGDIELMVLMQEEYELFLDAIKVFDSQKRESPFGSGKSKPEVKKVHPNDERMEVLFVLLELCRCVRVKAEDFILSVDEYYRQKGYITESQLAALENIHKYAAAVKK